MILVTGATGFIGSHLLEALAARGESVRCIVRRRARPGSPWQKHYSPEFAGESACATAASPGGAGIQPARPPIPGVDVVEGDLSTGEGLEDALRGVDAVIHLAGVTKALRAEDYYIGNARASERLAKAVSGRSLRLVHVSSLAACGPSRDGAPVTEDADPQPVSHYGRSKLEAERIVRGLVPDAVIVRPPVVYGPRDTDVFHMLKSAARGFVLRIAGGERWFSAIYARDLAEGLITAAMHPRAAGRTYFMTHPKAANWTRLGEIAAGIMGRRVRTVTVPAAAAFMVGYCAEAWSRWSGSPGIISREKVAEARCRYWTCDSRRAAAELGFEAGTSLEDGLARTLAWYKEAGWLRF